MRPLAYMETCGWLGSDVWYAHGIHFNDDELMLLAKTRTGVAHCPSSNMKLSSGVCKVPQMIQFGLLSRGTFFIQEKPHKLRLENALSYGASENISFLRNSCLTA